MNNFDRNFPFAEKHMPAIRFALGNLPAKMFFDINTATPQQDKEQATDLVLTLSSGDLAVRVRRREFWIRGLEERTFDWSVRAVNRHWKTEIQKLKDGFARWYFYGYSYDDRGKLAHWYLIDLNRVRAARLLDHDFPVHYNLDGTAGMYIPIYRLKLAGAVLHSYEPKVRQLPLFMSGGWEIVEDSR